ncbi:MAG: hypothetical protein VW338_14305 [Rhodospirillaceae bacterium]
MTELRTVAAADRYRIFQEAIRRRDQEQADQQRTRVASFDDRLQREAQASVDARRTEQRIQDRRDIIEADRALKDQLRDQQRTLDFLANDDGFVRRRDAIETELNGTRDARDLDESTLLRQLAGDRNAAAELRTIDQRNEDLRQTLIDREARIVERRIEDRNAAIQQEIQLQRSINRIRNEARSAESGAERPRGAVLDVNG